MNERRRPGLPHGPTVPERACRRAAAGALVDDRPENLLALTAVPDSSTSIWSRPTGCRGAAPAAQRGVRAHRARRPDAEAGRVETARLIKRRQRTRHIPIIFLTAISGEPEHYLRATRPVRSTTSTAVLPGDPARKVAVLLELWHRGMAIERQRSELEARLAELDMANERLARQAVELERSNAALERFAEVAAHELRQRCATSPASSTCGWSGSGPRRARPRRRCCWPSGRPTVSPNCVR